MILIITPRLIVQKKDFLGSGVPYWPIEAAILASFLHEKSLECKIFDLFSENPFNLEEREDHYLQGVSIETMISQKPIDEDIIFLYAISYMSHFEVLEIINILYKNYPLKTIIVFENTQAVTGYSLIEVKKTFLDAGADAVAIGELFSNWDEIFFWILNGKNSDTEPQNIITENSDLTVKHRVQGNVRYPKPAWNHIKIDNYWKLPYSHGPKTKKYLPILTSRGCPYPCDFCVIPETNHRKWKHRGVDEVLSEIIFFKEQYDVHHFQIEDLNPTANFKYWEELCKKIIHENLNIFFYFVSGTKAETVPIDKIKLLADAGCRFISISPEYGSQNLMKIIGKNFDYQHGLNLIRECRKYKIKTQACFLIGHPEEKDQDVRMSVSYLKKLVQAGLDEVAVFIIASFSGSKLFKNNSFGYDENRIPSFSPKGRSEYKLLSKRRGKLIKAFFLQKLFKSFDLELQGFRAIFGTPQTKIENVSKRIFTIWFLILKTKINNLAGRNNSK